MVADGEATAVDTGHGYHDAGRPVHIPGIPVWAAELDDLYLRPIIENAPGNSEYLAIRFSARNDGKCRIAISGKVD